MKKEVESVREQTWVMDILKDYKKAYTRLFVIWIITFISFIGLLCYTIYLSNDIGTIETNSVEQSDAENNNYIGNNGNITNGNTKDN